MMILDGPDTATYFVFIARYKTLDNPSHNTAAVDPMLTAGAVPNQREGQET
jgi:hypothetical protein